MKLHAFVAMPYGIKSGFDGKPIDFNRVYADYIKPALEAAGLEVFRADEEVRAGDIRSDMFQELLIADLVVADLSIDNPNVWYELGVRHALRARGVILIQSAREKNPFDIYTDRKLNYCLKDGVPNPETIELAKAQLCDMAKATLKSWHGKKISPVFNLLPNLEEPQWKRLKVGNANEFWEEHEDWEQKIEVARKRQRIGDILVLAEEAPVIALRVEAAFVAGEALRKLEHFKFAIEQFNHCLEFDPDNILVQQKKGLSLQRLGKFDEACELYKKILRDHPQDSETWSLLGRIEKDAWINSWRIPGNSKQQMFSAAVDEIAYLQASITSYSTGFRNSCAHYYSGINAVTLMHLYKHLTKKTKYQPDIAAMTGGVRWSAMCDTSYQQYWAKATLADLDMLTGNAETVKEAYQQAIVHADKDSFALNSTLWQLQLLGDLGFRPDCVSMSIQTFENALQKLEAQENKWQPRRVLLFSGHRVDATDRETPRFPFDKAPIAKAEILRVLAELEAGSEDVALTQGASGGDLIFAEACQERGVKLRLLQPFSEAEFIQRSIVTSEGDWRPRYYAVKAKLEPERPIRCMPEELGQTNRNPYERCNLWLLYTALSYGIDKVHFICLWDGGDGDGPGGTAHMYNEVNKRTGQVHWLDSRRL